MPHYDDKKHHYWGPRYKKEAGQHRKKVYRPRRNPPPHKVWEDANREEDTKLDGMFAQGGWSPCHVNTGYLRPDRTSVSNMDSLSRWYIKWMNRIIREYENLLGGRVDLAEDAYKKRVDQEKRIFENELTNKITQANEAKDIAIQRLATARDLADKREALYEERIRTLLYEMASLKLLQAGEKQPPLPDQDRVYLIED